MVRLKVPARLAGLLFIVALLVGSACSGVPGAPLVTQPAVPGVTPAPPDEGEPTAPSGVPGAWSGTITFHMVRNIDTTNTTTSGEGLFATTTTEHFELQVDITDTFTVTGSDPEDMEYGVGSVDLAGSVSNSGTTLERIVYVTDIHNALGCHYLKETGKEVDGSWTLGPDDAAGGVDFDEDGTYRISVRGGEAGEDEIPATLWETFTILAGAAIDCPAPGRSEVIGFGQYGDWAHIYGGGAMEGTLDPGNPGSVLDGTSSSETSPLEGTVTATWHLVHDGPINLPHEGPVEPE